MDNIKAVIEALLFVAETPLSIARIKSVMDGVKSTEIEAAIAELTREYSSEERGIHLAEVAGGLQFRTRPEYNPWVKRLIQPAPARLSRPAMETLAIVAYNQPVIRAEIEHIRGVDCGGTLRTLLEKRLIKVLGRKEIPGRPLIYATTQRFLEVFNLKDLSDLPSPDEIERLLPSPSMESETDGKTEEGEKNT